MVKNKTKIITLFMKRNYSKPETVFLRIETGNTILAISIDGNIKDMEEEGGDYDDGGSASTKGSIDPWSNGSSF